MLTVQAWQYHITVIESIFLKFLLVCHTSCNILIFLRKLAKHSGNLIKMLTYKDTNKTSLLSLPSHLCICPSAMLFPEPVTECWLSAAGPSSCSALSLLTQFTLSAQCPAPALLWSQDTGHKRGTRGGLTTHITRDIYHHINKTEALPLFKIIGSWDQNN